MKSSSAEFPLSGTDKTDKTSYSGPGIRLCILTPGVLSEGFWFDPGPVRPRHHCLLPEPAPGGPDVYL